MPKVNRLKESVAEKRATERISAAVSQLESITVYIAMMCDIDLSGAEEEDKK